MGVGALAARADALDSGGRVIHPVCGLPGGVSRGLTEEMREEFTQTAKDAVEFAKFTMQVFNETDFLQHALWHVMDPGHPRHDPAEHEAHIERIQGFYGRIEGVRRILECQCHSMGLDVYVLVRSRCRAGA